MMYENIKSIISTGCRAIILQWSILSILTIAGFVSYHHLNMQNTVLRNNILYFSEINSEAAFLLQQDGKIDNSKTALNSWSTLHKESFSKLLPKIAPEIALLESLGKTFYDSLENPNKIAYQNFYDQLQLLKRLAQTQIDKSYINIFQNMGIPIYVGIFLIILFASLQIAQRLSKQLINKNSLLLEELWEEIQDAPTTPDFSKPITNSLAEYSQYTEGLVDHSHTITNNISKIHDSLQTYLKEFTLPDSTTTDYEDYSQYKEKLTYVQKLLSRLFTRAERAATLAKASSDNGFQAGILALNISIEASKNGEHGKPFLSVSDRVKDFAEKSSHIGQAIMEELKDADLAIRKAYAVGKNIIETLPAESGTQQTTTAQIPDTTTLDTSIKNLEHLLAVSDKIYKQASELQQQLAKQTNSSVDPMDIRHTEIMKNVLVRNFERLYRSTYGKDPQIEEVE